VPEKSIKLKSKAELIPNPLIVRFIDLLIFIITSAQIMAISVPFDKRPVLPVSGSYLFFND
jgi:hypothetical protein